MAILFENKFDSNEQSDLAPAALTSSEGGSQTGSGLLSAAVVAIAGSSVLSACGAGGAAGSNLANASSAAMSDLFAATSSTKPPVRGTNFSPDKAPIMDTAASRFLAQSSMGASRRQITRVQSLGYAGWIEEQMAMPTSMSRYDWMVMNGYTLRNYPSEGFDAASLKKLVDSPDTLRQRVTLALSEIIVLSINSTDGFSGAVWMDLLEQHAFGNYRDILQVISMSAPMALYLTYMKNNKYDPVTGALPDENYAREIMQLFTIGLVQLNLDGTPKRINGVVIDTYTQADVMGLARVFTGWFFDESQGSDFTEVCRRLPMKQISGWHELGAKQFLGTTIAAGTDAATSLKIALDTLFAHPNIAPFISRQLIQRLVCSNPSPAYVTRVAALFNNDGVGIRGNLKVVIKAILLDTEARQPVLQTASSFGKLREPILRFTAWARAFNVSSKSGSWKIKTIFDPVIGLGQSPGRSPSVFNFFRPGYVQANSDTARAGLVAPEFQIANETTVIGYLNFMQSAISSGLGDISADYSTLLPLADNAAALLAEVQTVLAAGQLKTTSVATISQAINGMPAGNDVSRFNRIYATVLLVMAAPEFIIQK